MAPPQDQATESWQRALGEKDHQLVDVAVSEDVARLAPGAVVYMQAGHDLESAIALAELDAAIERQQAALAALTPEDRGYLAAAYAAWARALRGDPEIQAMRTRDRIAHEVTREDRVPSPPPAFDIAHRAEELRREAFACTPHPARQRARTVSPMAPARTRDREHKPAGARQRAGATSRTSSQDPGDPDPEPPGEQLHLVDDPVYGLVNEPLRERLDLIRDRLRATGRGVG